MQVQIPVLGAVESPAEATLFDFGATSVRLQIPFSLNRAELRSLAAWLAQPEPLVAAMQQAAMPIFEKIKPAIRTPLWSSLSEEYAVFEIPPPDEHFAQQLLEKEASWLASLLRLEDEELSSEEVAESLKLHLTYTPIDLFVCEWAAAVLVDKACEETLQIVELANVQLLELRHIDDRLDNRVEQAYQFIYPLARSWLPFWRTHARPLRMLGELKVEAYGLFERSNNVLKLVGDQYLARVHRLLRSRFHLEEWERNVRGSLQVVEEVYRSVADQAATYRTELLEIVIILLIFFEIVMTFVRR